MAELDGAYAAIADLRVIPFADGGCNIRIQSMNFTFAPEMSAWSRSSHKDTPTTPWMEIKVRVPVANGAPGTTAALLFCPVLVACVQSLLMTRTTRRVPPT